MKLLPSWLLLQYASFHNEWQTEMFVFGRMFIGGDIECLYKQINLHWRNVYQWWHSIWNMKRQIWTYLRWWNGAPAGAWPQFNGAEQMGTTFWLKGEMRLIPVKIPEEPFEPTPQHNQTMLTNPTVRAVVLPSCTKRQRQRQREIQRQIQRQEKRQRKIQRKIAWHTKKIAFHTKQISLLRQRQNQRKIQRKIAAHTEEIALHMKKISLLNQKTSLEEYEEYEEYNK